MDAQEQLALGGNVKSPYRFSLLNLFEIQLAYGIIFAAAHLLGGVLIFLGCVYPIKILLALAGRKHPLLAVIGYLCLVVSVVAWLVNGQLGNNITWIGIYICLPVIVFAIPTIGFITDMVIQPPPSPRLLIWRSVLEIVIFFPPWLAFSAYVGLYMGGWWI